MARTPIKELQKALETIESFKDENFILTVQSLEKKMSGQYGTQISPLHELYMSAQLVKKISTQINEIIHVAGIVSCLPNILTAGETITTVSLAAGAKGEGIDLVTNKRIAEFKFSHSINGMQKRNAFSDLVSLYLKGQSKPALFRELYVFNAGRVREVFSSNKSTWRNVLSKSGRLNSDLETFLEREDVSATTLQDIYRLSDVNIIDIKSVLGKAS